MPIFTIIVGVVMDLMGILGFVATGAKSVTALIPSIFGTLLIFFGILAHIRPPLRKHLMHASVVVALVAFVGAVARSGPKLPALLAGQPVEPSATAIWMQASFGLLALIYIAAAVRSFVNARLAAKSPASRANS